MTMQQTPVAHAVSALTLKLGASITVGQLNFAASIAFETLPLIAANPKFKFVAYARDVEEASGYTISAKTVQNAASLANQFHLKFGAKIGSYEGGHTEDNVLAFADMIRDAIRTTTYTAKIDDLVAFCKGEQSSADKRAAEAEARRVAADALATAAAQASLKQETEAQERSKAAADKAQRDAETKAKKATEEARQAQEQAAEADRKRAAALTQASADRARVLALEAQAKADAEAQQQEREAEAQRQEEKEAQEKNLNVMTVSLNGDNREALDIIYGARATPEILAALVKQMQADIKRMKAAGASVPKLKAA